MSTYRRRSTQPTGEQSLFDSPERHRAKKSGFSEGNELEYRTARLFSFMGFLVRRGREIYTVNASDRATDLDVFAQKYVEPFRREIVVAECKGGDSAPLDRVFWLSGVKSYVDAVNAYLVRKGTRWNIKDFANNAGIKILEFSNLAELEQAYKIGSTDWFGVVDPQFLSAARIKEWNQQINSSPDLWELSLSLASEVRFHEPFAALSYLIAQLRLLKDKHGKSSNALIRYFMADVLTHIIMFVMRIVETCFDLRADERRVHVLRGLTYGSMDPRYAERILNSAYNLTKQIVIHYVGQEVEVDRTLFRMGTPIGSTEIAEIVECVMQEYPISLDIPPMLDAILMEVFVKENNYKDWLGRLFPLADLNVCLILIQRVITPLVKADICPVEILDALRNMKDEIAQQPVRTANLASEGPLSVSPSPVEGSDKGHV